MQQCAIPSVAAMHGVAFGGGFELALACDLRVADQGARMGVPEIKLGLLSGAGGTARLTRMVPPAIAKQLLLTGDPITAAEAHRLGLVNEVVPPGGAKQLVDKGAGMTLESAVVFERETEAALFGTEAREEGVAAFLEKRRPTFHQPAR